MTQFQLEVLPNDEFLIETARQEILRRGDELAKKVEKEKKWLFDKSDIPKGLRRYRQTPTELFVEDLRRPCSWGILNYIQGSKQEARKLVQTAEERIGEGFYQDEVQEAFTIAVNAALLFEYEGCPGFRQGHSILHDSVASERTSPFYDTITPEFARRLHNGRFWENLRQLSPELNFGDGYRQVEDVLINHERDLDKDFLPEGMRIFYRSGPIFGEPFYLPGSSWGSLSTRAMRTYAEVLKRFESVRVQNEITEERFAPLVMPYIEALDATQEFGEPVFEDRDQLKQNPLVQQYSRYVEKEVAT